MNNIWWLFLFSLHLFLIISKSHASNRILPVNNFRIEVIALQDFLWHSIIRSNDDEDSRIVLQKVIQYYDQFIFSNTSFLAPNTTKTEKSQLNFIPELIEMEEETSLMFDDFLYIIQNTRDEDIDDVQEYIMNFADDILIRINYFNQFLEKLMEAMEQIYRIVYQNSGSINVSYCRYKK